MKFEAMIHHAHRSLGPLTYTDRELWGVRLRSIWLGTHVLFSWRVR